MEGAASSLQVERGIAVENKKGRLRRFIWGVATNVVSSLIFLAILTLAPLVYGVLYATTTAMPNWLIYLTWFLWFVFGSYMVITRYLLNRWKDKMVEEGIQEATNWFFAVPTEAVLNKDKLKVGIELLTSRPGGIDLGKPTLEFEAHGTPPIEGLEYKGIADELRALKSPTTVFFSKILSSESDKHTGKLLRSFVAGELHAKKFVIRIKANTNAVAKSITGILEVKD